MDASSANHGTARSFESRLLDRMEEKYRMLKKIRDDSEAMGGGKHGTAHSLGGGGSQRTPLPFFLLFLFFLPFSPHRSHNAPPAHPTETPC